MNISFVFNRKFIFFLVLSLIVSLFTVSRVIAQEAQDQAVKKYNVTFPVAELGACKNLGECKNYCEDPVNSSLCINFAKKKGFYKEDPIKVRKEEIVEAAKTQLGCDSESSCKAFCELEENRDKCASFAESKNLQGGYTQDSKKVEIIEKAKQVLGCNSERTCKRVCELEDNKEKCSGFAKEAGLKGGEQRKGPGGCASEDTCKAFCSDPSNFKECSSFGQKGENRNSASVNFKGPGGCNSESSCREYCSKNPKDCKTIVIGEEKENIAPGGFKSPEEFSRYCGENKERCIDAKEDSPEGKYGKHCRENPEKCVPTGRDASVGCLEGQFFGPGRVCTNVDKSGQAAECVKSGKHWNGSSCQTNPQKSEGYQDASNYYQPKEYQEEICKKGGGSCDWSSGVCSCKGYTAPTTGTYSPTTQNYTNTKEQQEAYCAKGGGSCEWSSSGMCNCKGYRSPSYGTTTTTTTTNTNTNTSSTTDPSFACKNAGGNWNGSYCQMPTTNTTTTTNTTPNQAPSGMTRESQEAGCKSCGGTCNWNGDFCGCQCGNTNSSSSTNTSSSTPAPAQTTQPTSATYESVPVSSPAVQGVSTVRSVWDRLMDSFRK